MKFDIVSFGSAIIDTFVETDIDKKTHTFSYPVGSKILIEETRTDVGGGGTNTATAFSRLGLKTGCICKVGNDMQGSEILELLKKDKITHLCKVGKGKTGFSVILDSSGNDRTVLTFKGESNNVVTKDILLFSTDWLYFSSLLGKSFKTQVWLAKKMSKNGTKVAFNPSEYQIKKMDIKDLLSITNVLILNKEEAALLSNKYNLTGEPIKSLTKLGPKVVVITDRDKIAYAYDGEKVHSITPHKIKVVERTGAGDAFASGFVAGLIVGYSIDKCLELALKEGESVLQRLGAKRKLLKMNLKRQK